MTHDALANKRTEAAAPAEAAADLGTATGITAAECVSTVTVATNGCDGCEGRDG